MPHRDNFLLSLLDPAVLRQIEPHLSVVDLEGGAVLAETHERVEKVYFPHSGIISCVVELVGGGAIATGMIGNDGNFGASQALDDKVSMNHVVVQFGGTVSVMSSERLREKADALPAFRKVLIQYDQFLLSQVQQNVACNASHNVQARTCKWLLRMYELVGADLMITQESMAQLIGVRRTSVTEVAGNLQTAGIISYHRGRLHIANLDRVRRSACECDGDVRSHHRKIFASNEGWSSEGGSRARPGSGKSIQNERAIDAVA
jgi:CRP-like cAMP-binding protein